MNFLALKLKKLEQKIDPKSLNSPSPGGLQVQIFLPAKFS